MTPEERRDSAAYIRNQLTVIRLAASERPLEAGAIDKAIDRIVRVLEEYET